MTDRSLLRNHPEEISAEWMQAALTAGGKFASPRIEAVEVDPMEAVTNALGTLVRCRLSVRADSSPVPESVIVKLPTANPKFMKLAKWLLLHKREYEYYYRLAPHSPMRSPALYYGAYDARSHRFVLIMEDLRPMETVPQARGVEGAQVHLAIRELAGMHGHFWDAVDRPDLSYLYDNFNSRYGRIMQAAYLAFVLPTLERFGNLFSPRMRRFSEALGPRITTHYTSLASGPKTLVHGDYRAENMFFDAAAKDNFAVIDWQGCGAGGGLYDVAYFLASSVSVDTRRRMEREVLEEYHDIVCRMGGRGRNYTFEDCWRSYRQNMLNAFVPCVLGCGSLDVMSDPRRVELATALLSRAIAAIEDLDADEFLPTRERILTPGYTFSALSRLGYGAYRMARRLRRKKASSSDRSATGDADRGPAAPKPPDRTDDD